MIERIKCFIDSNVWLYLFDPTSLKYKVARKLIKRNFVFLSVQVVNEVGRNLKDPKKPFKYTESQLREVIRYLYSPRFTFVELTKEVYYKASELREKYGFGYYDGIIVSAALFGKVKILYSEDMHDDLEVEGVLKIVNPFQK